MNASPWKCPIVLRRFKMIKVYAVWLCNLKYAINYIMGCFDYTKRPLWHVCTEAFIYVVHCVYNKIGNSSFCWYAGMDCSLLQCIRVAYAMHGCWNALYCWICNCIILIIHKHIKLHITCDVRACTCATAITKLHQTHTHPYAIHAILYIDI